MTLIHALYENSEKNSLKPAIVTEQRTYTYEQLLKSVESVAAQLHGQEFHKGDQIAIIMGNEAEFIISLYAIWLVGATAVPINPNYAEREIAYILAQSDAKGMIVHPNQGGNYTNEIAIDFELKIDLPFDNEVVLEQLAIILYTSGTTGNPKGAMLTHGNLYHNASDVADFLGIFHEDRMITVLPVFHVFALTVAVNAPLFQGATLLLQKSFSPKEVFRAANEQQATVFAGVPTMYSFLLHTPTDYAQPLGTIRLAISGGSSLPTAMLQNFEETFQLKISEGYGLSEASPVTCFNPFGKQKAGSIGQSIIHVENRIVDDHGDVLPVHEVGELVVRGKNVMGGYYKMAEETAKVLKNGWLHTGDLAYMDEDGYIFIVDRKKDVCIVGGYNVYPREVEEVLYSHGAIVEVAVVGEEDLHYGERVVAYVTIKGEVDVQSLFVHCQSNLVDYKVPSHIQIVEQLPKNSTGKIMKRLLKNKK